ncbi:IpaB/EvcA family [Yersinia aldovae]|uniref:hypothetical protein n=1 Tax=Yersinia aldovae TaxID=29483 RepID=UPI0005E627E6|nr:hypothetical protein [Yersinia aldovae]CNI27742.1 IpaB/EvcA family [Yersinia aldovae]
MKLRTVLKTYDSEKKTLQKARLETNISIISPTNNNLLSRLFGVKNTQVTIRANAQEAKINYDKVLGSLKQTITDSNMEHNKAWLIDERLTIVSVAVNQAIDHAHVGNESKIDKKDRADLLNRVKSEYHLNEVFFNTNSQEGITDKDLSLNLTQSSVRTTLQSDKYIDGKLAKVYPQFVKNLSLEQYQKIDLEKKKIKDIVIEKLMGKICTETIFGEKLLPMALSSLNKTVESEAAKIIARNKQESTWL